MPKYTTEERQLHKSRMQRLADHLLTGQLFHRKFNFAFFNRTGFSDPEGNGCGFEGCAIGELPGLFPEDWTWSYGNPRQNDPVLTRYAQEDRTWDSGIEFFGLDLRGRDAGWARFDMLFAQADPGEGLASARAENLSKERVAERLIGFINSGYYDEEIKETA